MNTLTEAIGRGLDRHYEDGLAEGRRLSAAAIERRDAEIAGLRAALQAAYEALKRATDALADGRDHLQEGEPRWERLDRAAQDAQVASMGTYEQTAGK